MNYLAFAANEFSHIFDFSFFFTLIPVWHLWVYHRDWRGGAARLWIWQLREHVRPTQRAHRRGPAEWSRPYWQKVSQLAFPLSHPFFFLTLSTITTPHFFFLLILCFYTPVFEIRALQLLPFDYHINANVKRLAFHLEMAKDYLSYTHEPWIIQYRPWGRVLSQYVALNGC